VILSSTFQNAPLSPLWNEVYSGGKLPLRVKVEGMNRSLNRVEPRFH